MLGEIAGAGCVKHIWMTMASLPDEPHDLRQTVLRMFWDGEAAPSVEVPLGDFFGVGFGLRRNFVSLPLQMSPEGGRALELLVPDAVRERCALRGGKPGDARRLFFFYIDYEEHAAIDPDLGRFHAWWNRTNPTAGTAREHGYTRADYGYSDARPSGFGLAMQGRGNSRTSPGRATM